MENEIVSVNLPVAIWNVVMRGLGKLPFEESAVVINEIKAQADAQLADKIAERGEQPAEQTGGDGE